MERLHNHVLTDFDAALRQLRSGVEAMSRLTLRALVQARRGLFERDEDACNRVIAEDETVDQLEKQVDNDGVAILTRFQPVAGDLRQVISAMKLSNHLERVADQAVNIARKARKLNRQPVLPESSWLESMFDRAMSLFKDSLQSYATGNVQLATTIKARDKTLDESDAALAAKLTDAMTQNASRIADYLGLLFISRHLERIGDHATNIAEEVVYLREARDIRHVKPSAKPPP